MDFGASVAQWGPAGGEVARAYHGSPGRSARPEDSLGAPKPYLLGLGAELRTPAAALKDAPPSSGPKLSIAPLGRGEPRSSPNPHFG